MSTDLLVDISRALEEKFYREKDAALLDYLRSQADESNLRAQLSEVSHIQDATVLDNLIRIGVNAESFVAFSLLPLVRVAWSDEEVADSEREAILKAAEADGILPDSANHKLLEGWLDAGPETGLLDTWRNYARALARELDETSLAAVRQTTLARARRISQAAGGAGDIANAEIGFFGSLLGFDQGFEQGLHDEVTPGHTAAGATGAGAPTAPGTAPGTAGGAHPDAAHPDAAHAGAAHTAPAHQTVDNIVGDPYALDELAMRLYPNIRSRLRQELLIDRERAGLLADFR